MMPRTDKSLTCFPHSASHILITGEDSDETCTALKDTIRRRIDIPAGVGLAQAFAAVRAPLPPFLDAPLGSRASPASQSSHPDTDRTRPLHLRPVLRIPARPPPRETTSRHSRGGRAPIGMARRQRRRQRRRRRRRRRRRPSGRAEPTLRRGAPLRRRHPPATPLARPRAAGRGADACGFSGCGWPAPGPPPRRTS
jgi:hypothetical protein